MKKLIWVAALALAFLPRPASATWSILAVDTRTGRVIIASATCAVPQPDNLKLVQAVVVPGVGVGANQSSVDNTHANHKLMYEQLLKGTDPDSIVKLMEKADSARIESRQIGIVDVRGRSSGRSGSGNSVVATDIQGRSADGVAYSVQGNIIAQEKALTEAARVMQETPGDMIDRVMLAMETASNLGGDRRCTCETGSGGPIPGLPCTGRASVTAYILVADPSDARGRYSEFHPQIPNRVRGDPSNLRAPWNDGDYYLYLAAYPSNTVAGEDSNPVRTLRMRYDAWKAKGRPRMNMAVPSPVPNP